jgi:hypothetical protein
MHGNGGDEGAFDAAAQTKPLASPIEDPQGRQAITTF